MEQNRPRLIATEERAKLPILIVDKKGFLGNALAQKLLTQFLVVFVSSYDPAASGNLVAIPYPKKIPLIPDHRYAPIFVVYQGEQEILDILPVLIKKASESRSLVYLLLPIDQCTDVLLKYLLRFPLHELQTMVIGEIFDNNPVEENDLNVFIKQARASGRVEISDTGLRKLYPVLLEDAVQGILSIAFSGENQHRLHLLFPRHPFTEFTAARLLQKINPSLRLDFQLHKSEPLSYVIPTTGVSYFPNYNLEEKLRTIDVAFAPIIHPTHTREKIKLPRLKKKSKQQPILLVFAWGIVIFFFLPIIVTFSSMGVGVFSLQGAVKSAEDAQFSSAGHQAEIATDAFTVAHVFADGIFPLALFAPIQHERLLDSIAAGKQVSNTGNEVFAAFATIQKITQGTSNNPQQDFLQATATIKNGLLVLQKLQAEDRLPAELQDRLVQTTNLSRFIENTIDTWPTVFGFEGKRTYLVLFQNNMELRPGGGFIGSYGLLKLEHGQMSDFKINDVYDADGQLTEHVEPPAPLRRYLGASHWYLRDSNFDVDFTRNASLAQNFLTKETNDKVDGVIAIDTLFLKNMLEAMGSVTVPDYNTTVTADNFYQLTQTHAQKDFFPGSSQKKDFLRALSNAMLAKLTEDKSLSYAALLTQLGKSLQEKDLLLAFNDPSLQKVYTVNNLSSSLWDGRLQEANTYLDTLGIIDANLGENKVNYYVRRAISQQTQVEESGDIQTTVHVEYNNTSKKNSAFGGEYENYVRFLLPKGAAVQDVAIDGKVVQTTPAVTDSRVFTRRNFVAPKEMELEQTTEEGKALVGMLVLVPTESRRTVSLTYTIRKAFVPTAAIFTYDLLLFKQPGSIDDQYSFDLSYPASLAVVDAEPKAADVGGKLRYAGALTKDTSIRVVFSKK